MTCTPTGLVAVISCATAFPAPSFARIEGGDADIAPGEAKPLSAVSLVSGAVRSMITRKSETQADPGPDDTSNGR